jgi:hypothetical protein
MRLSTEEDQSNFAARLFPPFAQIEWAAALLDVGPRMRSVQKNREATPIPEIARIGVAGKGCPTSLRHLATGTQNAASAMARATLDRTREPGNEFTSPPGCCAFL